MHSFVKFDLTEFCHAIEIPLGNSNTGRTDVEPTVLSVHPWLATGQLMKWHLQIHNSGSLEEIKSI